MSSNGYDLVWEDTFSRDGPVDRSKWDFDVGTGDNGWGNVFSAQVFTIKYPKILGNQEAQYYTDRVENVRCQGQRLIIEARREDYGGRCFTSARLKSKEAWTYGRLQVCLENVRSCFNHIS